MSAIPLETLDVNIPTIDRGLGPLEYVHRTLASLLASDWQGRANLIVGDGRQDYLDRWRGHPRVTIVPFSVGLDGLKEPQAAAVAFRARFQSSKNRRNNNYLAHGVALSWSPGFMLEDDVEAPPDWIARVRKAINLIPENAGGWVLALNHGRPDVPVRHATDLVGSQGLLFSSYDRALTCVKEHRRLFNPRGSACSDVAIGKCACVRPVLWSILIIKHIGAVSTFHLKIPEGALA
jgi:hypothetical protein